ncbi:MAG: putative Zn-dependent protease, partial [Flavobacteriaceae bacterium]
REIKDKEAINLVDSVLLRICTANNIDRSNLKLHLLDKDEINAFALPGGHLVIFSGLITACENSDELAGVIAHEVAHITENHVAKKLAKEIGFGVVTSIAGGTAGAEIIKEAARVLSSSAFDRAIEKDADIKAVDYLVEAKIATKPFADFLYKRSLDDDDLMNYISWISTHPNPEERAQYILEYGSTKSFDPTPSLSESAWAQLEGSIGD